MRESIQHFINTLSQPTISFLILFFLFFFIFPPNAWFHRINRKLGLEALWTVKGGIAIFASMTALLIFGGFDANFRSIILKPDNVPIILLLFGSIFFLWLSMHQAMQNDRRLRGDEPPEEWVKESDRKVLVWPDLVYIELIAMVLCMVLLLVWSIVLKAPLEEPADPSATPNPSKAPWYFLALQEMLVYFDPWLAGVVFPTLIIVGLMAIPYMDTDRSTSGFYSYEKRRTFISLFLFGWLVLWVYMIIVGTFLRGPGWNFFGPFERWDLHKVVALNNVNVSEIVYVKMLGQTLPDGILIREGPGILLILVYFLVIPPLLAKTSLKGFFNRMGSVKYSFFIFFCLTALSLPLKMLSRWFLNLKYFIATPWFNI
ncbi:MAG: cytochrome C [Verrucomicrobia bacterium]|nr:cytochrome C [Verrucomicrobiota bacterium]MDA1086777.1 cytochrome C [Verrucomicrobiota bacterium]